MGKGLFIVIVDMLLIIDIVCFVMKFVDLFEVDGIESYVFLNWNYIIIYLEVSIVNLLGNVYVILYYILYDIFL